jgi:probable phosphoglycerate mutase
MSAPHVFLVRHGRTVLNAAGRLRGRLDPPLDDLGRAQAQGLAEQLTYSRPVRIVSSPLQRAVQTAHPLCKHLNVPLTVEPRLADRDYGSWAGEEVEAIVARFGSLDAAPGVESADSVLARARAVLEEQRSVLRDGPVVLIAHDVVNRLLLASLDPRLGTPDAIPQRTGCWNVLTLDRADWRVDQVDQRADMNERFE